MTGALEYLRPCSAVWSEVCDKSTRIPRRFISSIRRYPSLLVGGQHTNTDHTTYVRISPQSPVQGGNGFEVSSRISERVVTHVRQCHVSHAERV